jgi:hypothetical protein
VLGGVAFVLVVGLVVMLLLGVVGLPRDFLRRLRQSAGSERSERGGGLPPEVPTASAEETAQLVDDVQRS